MRSWVVGSAVIAPVALIGGWTLAQASQPAGFSSCRQSISALAAVGASDRWVMTTGLLLLGLCHLMTAAGLTDAGRGGRALLALGGAATVGVAALPQPAAGHVVVAAIALGALAVWPAVSWVPGRPAGVIAAVVLLLLLGWFTFQLRGGSLLGLTERLLAGAEALWPLTVVSLLASGGATRRAPHD